MLLTLLTFGFVLAEHGQVYTWGGGSRGQLGHGTLTSEETPRLVMALDGLRIIKIAAGGWHSAAISESHDLYMFGWNESGQLAQQTNLARPAECFSAVEKLLMACCTGGMAEGAALPTDSEAGEPGAAARPQGQLHQALHQAPFAATCRRRPGLCLS